MILIYEKYMKIPQAMKRFEISTRKALQARFGEEKHHNRNPTDLGMVLNLVCCDSK